MYKKFANLPSTTPEMFYALVLFTRLVVIAISLERLLPTQKLIIGIMRQLLH